MNVNIYIFITLSVYLVCTYCCRKNLNICIGLAVITMVFVKFSSKYMGITLFKESFANFNQEKIGPYDGLVLKSDERPDLPFNDPNNTYTLQGSPAGLEDSMSKMDITAPYMPKVDGETDSDSPNSMFMFSYNESSPDCCPSSYTTDRGCVCTSKNQRSFINTRGGNRSNGIY